MRVRRPLPFSPFVNVRRDRSGAQLYADGDRGLLLRLESQSPDVTGDVCAGLHCMRAALRLVRGVPTK
ncbi:hypothetical protein BRADI_1g66605v3 [Brachypodium distachyon]|uniref:Uncharacterized protein n=1 Tax=Brachypodium distachyon TaxID=15368 RepID=A0A2K2DTR5_BRADI|nr:hypothetical protein BRADI_1g66605v3 [Brachypodium distachyon]